MINIEDVNIEEEKEEVTNGSRLGIKWNPITIIRKYRCSVDPFRHLDFPMGFLCSGGRQTRLYLHSIPF